MCCGNRSPLKYCKISIQVLGYFIVPWRWIWVWWGCSQECGYYWKRKEEFLLLKRLISQWEMRSSCTKISFSIKSKRGKEDESECSSFLIKEVRSYSLIWFYEESRNCLQKHSLSQNGAWMQKAETYLAENILSLQIYALKVRFPSRPWWTSPCLAELGNRTQF